MPNMKPMSITGALLLIVGIVLLAYQGFSFTQRENVANVGPVHINADKEKTVLVPPIVGWVVTGVGAVLLVAGLRKSA
jgi:hypothetical protein